PDAELLEAVLKRARRAYQDYRASRQSGGRIVMFCQVRRKRSVSRMGSVTLLSKGVVFPSRTDTSLIKCGGVRAWIPRRNQRCAFDASTRNSGTKRELRCFSQATSTGGRVPSVPEGELVQARRGRAVGCKNGGTLAQRCSTSSLSTAR